MSTTCDRPSDDRIRQELIAAVKIKQKYGTNQPNKNYEDGLIDGLHWVLGGEEPQKVEAE